MSLRGAATGGCCRGAGTGGHSLGAGTGGRSLGAGTGGRSLGAGTGSRRRSGSTGSRRRSGSTGLEATWLGNQQRRRRAGRDQRRHSWASFDSGPVTSQTPVDPLSPTQSCGVWEIHRALVISPEPKQMEDCRVVELRHRSEPAEFPAANSIVCYGWIILSRFTRGSRNEETRIVTNEVFNE